MGVVCEETFHPAAANQSYGEIAPHFAAISESAFGLQCGAYENSIPRTMSELP
jgi:hypothetical protein